MVENLGNNPSLEAAGCIVETSVAGVGVIACTPDLALANPFRTSSNRSIRSCSSSREFRDIIFLHSEEPREFTHRRRSTSSYVHSQPLSWQLPQRFGAPSHFNFLTISPVSECPTFFDTCRTL